MPFSLSPRALLTLWLSCLCWTSRVDGFQSPGVSFQQSPSHEPSTKFPNPRVTASRSFGLLLASNNHHRVDVIDAHPEVAVAANDTNTNIDNADTATVTTTERKSKVRRYYETFLWKKNDMTTEDYKINYRVEGPIDGPPILLVHGFGANVNHFRFQFPALVQEGYRVYAIDLLGFGASDKPQNAPYSIELFVQLMHDFILAMNPHQTWVVAGNSVGGLCSLGLASRLPNLIRGVVLFNTSSGMSAFRYEEFPLFVRPILWAVRKFLLGNPERGGNFFEQFKTRRNVERILMTQGVYGNTTNVDEELLEILLGPADDEGAREVFLKVFGGDPGPTPQSFLAKIECPVLALWGEADPWTVIANGEAFGKQVNSKSQYRLERLPGAGHCPHDEAPELVHEIMLPWLRDLLKNTSNTTAATASTTTPTTSSEFTSGSASTVQNKTESMVASTKH